MYEKIIKMWNKLYKYGEHFQASIDIDTLIVSMKGHVEQIIKCGEIFKAVEPIYVWSKL